MAFLWSLFNLRRQYRHYARVDQIGICRGFKHCQRAPAGHEWVEINEPNIAWLSKPLPISARILRGTRQSAGRMLHAA